MTGYNIVHHEMAETHCTRFPLLVPGRTLSWFGFHLFYGFCGEVCVKKATRRLVSGMLLGALVVVSGLGLSFDRVWQGSSARFSGHVVLRGLSDPVRIERDRQGIPTIRARNADDAYEALGFVQAQDRFFEMDLLRRVAAGRLAALVGSEAERDDERIRRFRLEAVVRAAYARATP
ncbi:Peptidase S45, penicillin amidase, partial [mine drainage metagenome]